MEVINLKVSVVLPAAGCGDRFGADIPKQYQLICQRPLLSYTLQAFERISWVDNIVLVVSASRKELVQGIIDRWHDDKRIRLTEGQSTRHRSIWCGIKALKKVFGDPEVVIIHDVVRPFVDEPTLRKLVLAANEFGAAGAVRPLVSTILQRDTDGFLDHSLVRSKYVASEMPQAFRFSAIATAYEKCSEHDLEFGTECLHLAQAYAGVKVKLVDGLDNLWKVTYKKDLYAAEYIIKAAHGDCGVLVQGNAEICDVLKTALQERDMKVHLAAAGEAHKYIEDQLCGCVTSVDSPDEIQHTWLNLAEQYSKVALQGTIVFLLYSSELSQQPNIAHVRSALKLLANTHASLCVYGIIIETAGVDKAAQLAVDLVKHPNPCLSAQVFLV